jgi:hypothetical protein
MKRLMIISALAISIATIVVSCTNTAEKTAEQKSETKGQLIKRGEYLVTIGGCNDCHTPKMMTDKGPALDPTRIMAGHIMEEVIPEFYPKASAQGIVQSNMNLTAWQGPWGTSFTANLTPDVESGIGNWTLDQFKIALRQGKSKGLPAARPLLPPMPWFNFINMPDEDVEAIFTYLQSLPPIKNFVPAPIDPS